MEFSSVFHSIFIIGIMILLGTFLSRTFPFNNDTRKLFISIIVNVAMPSIILSSILNVEVNTDTFKWIMIVFFLSILINLIGIALGWAISVLFHRQSMKIRELAIMSGLGNTGFIGIPLCAALIGPEGALYAAIFDAGVDITIWTVGVIILQKKKQFTFQSLRTMINIPTGAILLGLVIAYFNLKPPAVIIQVSNQLASMAAPLAMIYIGVLIMSLRGKKLGKSSQEIWIPLTVKLILLPACVAIFIPYLHLTKDIFQTILIQSMMPTLTLTTILFAKYAADEEMGALTTVTSTIFALLTIPLLLFIIF